MKEWDDKPFDINSSGKEVYLMGPSPGGAIVPLKSSRQRIHYLIKKDYLDAVYIYERGKLVMVMVTDESIERFRENPNPKPGPKQKADKVSITELARWVLLGMYQDLKTGFQMSDEECRKWIDSTPDGKEFRKRLNYQYGTSVDRVEDLVVSAAVKLGLKKARERGPYDDVE